MNTNKIIQEIFHETNRQRDAFGLPVLLYSKKLEQAAMLHSGNMVKHNFFSHDDPYNLAFADAMTRVLNCKGDFNIVAENLACYPFTKNGMVVFGMVKSISRILIKARHPHSRVFKNRSQHGARIHYVKQWKIKS